MKFLPIISLLVFVLYGCNVQKLNVDAPVFTKGQIRTSSNIIESFSNELLSLIDTSEQYEVLANNLQIADGPVWIAEHDMLLFSEMRTNKILKWTEETGIENYVSEAGYSGNKMRNSLKGSGGLARDREGSLLVCQQGDKVISILAASFESPKPNYLPIIYKFLKRKFFSPHDLSVDTMGNIFFIDNHIVDQDFDAEDKSTLPFIGLYCYTPKGKIIQLEDIFTKPNGIAVAPNGSYLIVSNSDPDNPYWYKLEIDSALKIGRKGIIQRASSSYQGNNGLPDGIKIHPKNYIFSAGPDGVWIMSSEGALIGKIHTDCIVTNIAFDNTYGFLYITAEDKLLRIKLRNFDM